MGCQAPRPTGTLSAHMRLRRRRDLGPTSLSPQAVRQSTQHRSHLPLPITKAFGEILLLKRQSFSLIHPIAIPCPKHACFNRTAGFQGYSRLRIGRALSISLQNSLIPGNSSPRRVCRRLHPPPLIPSETTRHPRCLPKEAESADICGYLWICLLGESASYLLPAPESRVFSDQEIGETAHFDVLAEKSELDAEGLAILGMGDIATLLERAEEKLDRSKAEAFAKP